MKKTLLIFGVILIPIILIILLVCLYRYYAYYPLQKINPKGEELAAHSISPNRQYDVKVYRSSGGATVSWTLRGVVHNNKNDKTRIIYWNEGEKAQINWVNNTTVIINGKKINVIKGSYDYRFAE
ncbi:DUF5412 family protein [Neobacillus sp. PS3-34]|uniref:DUF5412 family protein n=1 Tax=Neobacillus sp. PS3-34 TaxID=3070678 RepID=UPI0027E07F97|nr:DUF5412 family protein [Neobacillus sp. PS3-34]WML46734.1 DUF5412 family protein [Neobacillus sp. PS3-34]